MNCLGSFVYIQMEYCDAHDQLAVMCKIKDAEDELTRLRAENKMNGEEANFQTARADKAEAECARMRERLDRTFTAALRYESRHDRDPERGKLWGELKMALMVDAPSPESRKPCSPTKDGNHIDCEHNRHLPPEGK